MKTELQKSLAVALKNAEDLRSKIVAKTASADEIENFKKYTQEAKPLAEQIDAEKMLDDVKEWSKQSDGKSVVPASFDRLALTEEGAIKGVTAYPKTGELVAIPGFMEEGEANIKALKSGAYKDFFAQKLRAQSLHGQDWKSYIKGNAMKVLNEGSFTAGEAWIPPDFRANLVQRLATLTSVRPNATVMTTGSDHITFPQAVYTTDDLYSSPFRATWQGSGAQTSSPAEGTNPVSGQVRLTATSCTTAGSAEIPPLGPQAPSHPPQVWFQPPARQTAAPRPRVAAPWLRASMSGRAHGPTIRDRSKHRPLRAPTIDHALGRTT